MCVCFLSFYVFFSFRRVVPASDGSPRIGSDRIGFPFPSSRFLKKADPAHPPPLILNKYQDPIRSDVLPEDEETFWIGTSVKEEEWVVGAVVRLLYLGDLS